LGSLFNWGQINIVYQWEAHGVSLGVSLLLSYLAKAKGMTEIAKASGLTREALYKALRADSQPRLDTIQRVCTALGVKLSVVPA
jgi:probable addiction module antidote protein